MGFTERFQTENRRKRCLRGICPMKALITGGAGFIGSHLADMLLKDGDEVYVLDDLSTGSLENIAHLEGTPALPPGGGHRPASRRRQRAREQGRRRLPPRSRGGGQDDRRAAGQDAPGQPRRHRDRLDAAADSTSRCSLASTSEVYGDHRTRTRSPRRPAASTARRRRSAGPTPTRRRWTSSSRSRTTRSTTSTP